MLYPGCFTLDAALSMNDEPTVNSAMGGRSQNECYQIVSYPSYYIS